MKTSSITFSNKVDNSRQQSFIAKAMRFISDAQVTSEGNGTFTVGGHSVSVEGSHSTCDCEFRTFNPDSECSHSIAARIASGQNVISVSPFAEVPEGFHPMFRMASGSVFGIVDDITIAIDNASIAVTDEVTAEMNA